jgi:hypothetical protein
LAAALLTFGAAPVYAADTPKYGVDWKLAEANAFNGMALPALLPPGNDGGGKVQIKWKPSEGAYGYALRYAKKSDSNIATDPVVFVPQGSGEMSCTLAGLEPGTPYQIILSLYKVADGVKVVNRAGSGQTVTPITSADAAAAAAKKADGEKNGFIYNEGKYTVGKDLPAGEYFFMRYTDEELKTAIDPQKTPEIIRKLYEYPATVVVRSTKLSDGQTMLNYVHIFRPRAIPAGYASLLDGQTIYAYGYHIYDVKAAAKIDKLHDPRVNLADTTLKVGTDIKAGTYTLKKDGTEFAGSSSQFWLYNKAPHGDAGDAETGQVLLAGSVAKWVRMAGLEPIMFNAPLGEIGTLELTVEDGQFLRLMHCFIVDPVPPDGK